LRAKFGESGAAFGGVAVFDPVRKFLSGEAADVCGEIGLCADEFAKTDEFVGTEFVGFEFVIGGRLIAVGADPEIGAAWAFFGRADTVAPIVGNRRNSRRGSARRAL